MNHIDIYNAMVAINDASSSRVRVINNDVARHVRDYRTLRYCTGQRSGTSLLAHTVAQPGDCIIGWGVKRDKDRIAEGVLLVDTSENTENLGEGESVHPVIHSTIVKYLEEIRRSKTIFFDPYMTLRTFTEFEEFFLKAISNADQRVVLIGL